MEYFITGFANKFFRFYFKGVGKSIVDLSSKTRILFQLLLEQDVDIATEGTNQNRELYDVFSAYDSIKPKISIHKTRKNVTCEI